MKMSDELDKNSELEFVDKAAVVAVFLLAGLFLWQFLGNGSVTSIDDLSGQDTTVKDEPQTYYKSQSEPLETEKTVKENPVTKITDSATSPVKEASKKDVIEPSIAQISPIEKPVEEIKKLVEPVEKIKEIIPPTISPVATSDLTQGILKLSGTGEPRSALQLMLNGQKTSSIDIDNAGKWSYQTNLKPGDYSVQVLSKELDEKINNQSALTKISIPQKESSISKTEIKLEKERESIATQIKKLADEVKEEKNKFEAEKAAHKTQKQINAKLVDLNRKKPTSTKKVVKKNKRYKIKYGDTINELSRRFNVSRRQLLKANNISDKDVIEVNEMLIIPGH